jgi:hypothetical protein
MSFDAPQNSLKDSNVSPKMKITEEGVGTHSLTRRTLVVRGACWSFGMGIRKNGKHVNYSYQYTQTKQQIG